MDTILTYEADPPIPEGMDKALPLYAPASNLASNFGLQSGLRFGLQFAQQQRVVATKSVHVLHVLHVLWKLETRASPLTILHGLQGQG